MMTKTPHSRMAGVRISGVYLNSQQAQIGVRELEIAGFQPSVSSTGSEKRFRSEENAGLEAAPPLDDVGIGSTLTGTLPVRAKEGSRASDTRTEEETSVSVSCRDNEEADRVDSILRRTGARNVQRPQA